jgi:starch-binding outer membrane protein, SusD/RagB family
MMNKPRIMKNRIIKNLLALFIVASIVGCEKRLDIEPTQSVDESQALRTSSDVEAALIGAYRLSGDADVLGGGSKVNAELLGSFEDINWSGTFQGMTQIFNKSIPVNNGFITSQWSDSYETINTLNNVITSINRVDENKRDRVEGEAKFLRGLIYFELVKAYGKDWNNGDPNVNLGVPIVLEPTRVVDSSDKVARATVAEVYDLVIADLTQAKDLLPQTNSFFATTYSASAILARLYLQQSKYEEAASEANRVIASDEYELTDTYAESFPMGEVAAPRKNTIEEIFAIQVNTTVGVNDFNTYFSPLGRGDIDIPNAHTSKYEANDDRLNLFYIDGGARYTGKHDNQYGNVTIVRLAEMYLIRAEANFRLGGTPIGGITPAADINRLRDRVGLNPINEADLTLEAILKERRLELAFEGFALDDVKRLKQNVGATAWNSPKLVFPIPERETLVNENLEQNEGY